ncbi:MAG: hypothetical protein IJE26_01615 [Oscillospiraceae bacterium]|nr:hypothetical protein [Oscillospiraceae bacterium]
MAGKHSQGSHSSPQDFTDEFVEEQSSETVYETKRFFGRKKAEETYDEPYDEEYEEEYGEWEEEEEDEKPRFGFLRGFGRRKKEEEYEEYEEEYDDEYEDEYDEYEEDEKPRFNLFASLKRQKQEPEEEYERYAEAPSYDDDFDDDDAVSLDSILTAVLGFLMVVALAVSVFAAFTLFSSGKVEKAAEPTEAPVQETMMPSQAEQQASGQLAAATPEPTGSKAVLTAEGILVPGERGPVVPERDTKKPLEEFATVTMIGNSFVEGMKLWSDIQCEYVCADGVSLDNMIGNHLYFVTVRDYDAIYLTLGLNEIGWPVDSFISKYEKVIDYIRSDAYSKTATIYITSVMPVEQLMETQKAESGQTIKLSTIQTFNEALKEMCQRKGCWYLDVYSALADETGYLPADIAADDHVHFEKTGYRIWTEYLQSHYVDESLVEG